MFTRAVRRYMTATGPSAAELASGKARWFPQKLSDIDSFGLVANPDLHSTIDLSHPCWSDKEYRTRRDEIASIGTTFKIGESIPTIDYLPEETEVWGKFWDVMVPLYKHACKEYNDCFTQAEKDGLASRNRIPQLQEVNEYLQASTGWRIKPANGIVSQRQYLNMLAYKVFICTQYVRHHTSPHFTPEPDFIHEFYGHVPMLADEKFAAMSQQIGILSLGASDEQVKLLGAIYWYTVEFGACWENGERKFAGAAIGSSFGELENFLQSEPFDRRLDLENNMVNVEYLDQVYQDHYFIADSFDDMCRQIRDLEQYIPREFKVDFSDETETAHIVKGEMMERTNE